MFGPGLLRVILASLVVLSHTSGIKLGIIAVIVFFILSGYWVTRQYDLKYRHDSTPVKTFYLARFLRIWPAYAVALALTLAIRAALGLVNDPEWPLALPLFGVASHPHDPLGVSWSLDIELQFYLLAPLILPLLTLHRAALLLLLLPVTLIGLALQTYLGPETVLITLSAFVFGALIHVANLRFTAVHALASVAVALAVLLAIRFEITGLPAEPPYVRFGVHGMVPSLAVGLLLVPLVGYAVRLPSSLFDRRAGDFSYSLYLVHYPFFEIVRDATGSDLGDLGKIAMILTVYPLSFIFFTLVDRPIDRWRISRVETAQRAKVPGQS